VGVCKVLSQKFARVESERCAEVDKPTGQGSRLSSPEVDWDPEHIRLEHAYVRYDILISKCGFLIA